MRTAIVISMVYTLCALSPALGQTPDKYVQIGDTTINLADVDLKKGMVAKIKEFSYNTSNNRKLNNYIKYKVFTSPKRENYVVILDTIQWFEGSRYREKKTVLQYFSKNNMMLFKKQFTGLDLFVSYISSSGEVVVTSQIRNRINN